MTPPRLLVRAAIVCIAAFTTLTAIAFEGRVDFTMTTAKQRDNQSAPMNFTYFLKGTRMRTEFTVPPDKRGRGTGTFASIIDWSSRDMTIIMDEQKMYMVRKLPEVANEAGADKKGTDFQFAPTGRKEKIAGIDAEEYAGESDGKRTEVWVTKELGKFMMANQGKGGGPFGRGKTDTSAWEKFAQNGDFFALRVIQRAKEGAPEDFHMEATKVDRSPVAEAKFAPPDGYKKFEMPSMGDAFKGLIPH